MLGSRRSKRVRRQFYDDPTRWVIPYADLLTLLFAFFVVMYAISSVNLKKYQSLQSSVSDAFEGKKGQPRKKILEPAEIINKLEKAASSDFRSLNAQLRQNEGKFFKVRGYDGWYEIEVKTSQLFKSGQAILTEKAKQELQYLAIKLSSVSGPITVEGYTDNIPMNSLLYSSNWALSSARAASVAQILDESGLSSQSISAVGYGAQFPIARNITVQGRAKNRRVVIVVAKNHSNKRLLNAMQTKIVLSKETKLKPKVKTIKVKVMKEIRTKSGGIKFIQVIEEHPVPNPK